MPKERDWSPTEVDAIVADTTLTCSRSELKGRHYVQAGHRRALQTSLDGRSEGSIEKALQHPWVEGWILGMALRLKP